MDGHGSHLTIEFMDICWDNKIVPFKLIAHSTHLLQPCDVGFFQPMKQHHQNILAEQIRFGGSDYSRNDFLDAYNEISLRTKKKNTIKHAWEKAGLWPFKPHTVLNKMQRMEAPHRLLNSDRFRTPEPQDPLDWVSIKTPDATLCAIKPYDEYIDHRLKSAVEGVVPLSPTISHVINKRNKAQNIIILNGILSTEQLEKHRAEAIRKAKHKKEGSQRRVQTDYGVITKGDGRLRIAGRAQFLAQEKARRQQVILDKVNKLADYRWGVTARAAARWAGRWQDSRAQVARKYMYWMAELMHFHSTGSCILIPMDD
jgi:hypothetical protein